MSRAGFPLAFDFQIYSPLEPNPCHIYRLSSPLGVRGKRAGFHRLNSSLGPHPLLHNLPFFLRQPVKIINHLINLSFQSTSAFSRRTPFNSLKGAHPPLPLRLMKFFFKFPHSPTLNVVARGFSTDCCFSETLTFGNSPYYSTD